MRHEYRYSYEYEIIKLDCPLAGAGLALGSGAHHSTSFCDSAFWCVCFSVSVLVSVGDDEPHMHIRTGTRTSTFIFAVTSYQQGVSISACIISVVSARPRSNHRPSSLGSISAVTSLDRPQQTAVKLQDCGDYE